MPDQPPRPPWDPVKGAWWLLLAMILGLIAHVLGQLFGCVIGVSVLCERSGDSSREVALELITAVALLVAVRPRDK